MPRFDSQPLYNVGNGLKRKLCVYIPLPLTHHHFLPSLSPSLPCSLSNDHSSGASNKKNKKSSASSLHKSSNNSSSSSLALDPNDSAALNRRAQRFQREHDIERKKALYGNANGNGANSRNYVSTPDDPEGDPVRFKLGRAMRVDIDRVHRTYPIGTATLL